MKEAFAGYFPMKEADYSDLWKNASFVLDANVLLDLYRYTSNTADELMSILLKIRSRIWLPHQAGLEFFRNRPKVILEQKQMFARAISITEALLKTAETEINSQLNFRNHPSIDKTQLLKDIEGGLTKVKNALDSKQKQHSDLLKKDPILEKLATLFDEKIGKPYSKEDLQKRFAEAKQRYGNKIPPGFEDAKSKDEIQSYGDYLLWRQILDYAENQKVSIIFVSNERKDDWWWNISGRTISPRPELIEEMKSVAGTRFYAYNSDRFMSYAREYLKAKVKQDSIDEVQQVRENNELLRFQQATIQAPTLSSPVAGSLDGFPLASGINPVVFHAWQDAQQNAFGSALGQAWKEQYQAVLGSLPSWQDAQQNALGSALGQARKDQYHAVLGSLPSWQDAQQNAFGSALGQAWKDRYQAVLGSLPRAKDFVYSTPFIYTAADFFKAGMAAANSANVLKEKTEENAKPPGTGLETESPAGSGSQGSDSKENAEGGK